MQSTSSKMSLQGEAHGESLPEPPIADSPSLAYRFDTGITGSIANAPHHPVLPKRAMPGRTRGERPKLQQGLDTPKSEAEKAWAPQCAEPKGQPETDPMPAERSDVDWKSLQAEDIAQILDRRLNELERRERLLNRRAHALAQHERMFRLWANEQRLALNHQSQELQNRQRELQQRSSDLRWLLVFGDRLDCSDSLSTQPQDESNLPVGVHEDIGSPFRFSVNEEQYALDEMAFWASDITPEFREDSLGIRRLQT